MRFSLFFFFNDTATTEIYTLSLHDALPICVAWVTAKPSALSSSRSCSWLATRPERTIFRIAACRWVFMANNLAVDDATGDDGKDGGGGRWRAVEDGGGKDRKISLLADFEGANLAVQAQGAGALDRRSEERRVGKECRSRWSPYH